MSDDTRNTEQAEPTEPRPLSPAGRRIVSLAMLGTMYDRVMQAQQEAERQPRPKGKRR